MINRPNAILFDWDGTLVDSFAFLNAAHNHTCKALGRPEITVEQFKQYFGKPREILYVDLYGAENVDAAKGLFEGYVIERHMHDLKQMIGAEGLLNTLYDLGFPMGVVSNKRATLITQEAAHYNWDNFFSSIVGAAEAEKDKPSPAPLKLCLERMNMPQDRHYWYVGDTENDLIAAHEAGFDAVLIGDDEKAKLLNKEHSPAYFFKNCTEFNEFLLQSFLKKVQNN